ncbi:hypothetical protein CXA49_004869, partial [Salmonella enterica]|nr:hypothetical protein [Salmonella enterica]
MVREPGITERKSRIMNKIYKLKYDRRRQQLVAVSELTT